MFFAASLVVAARGALGLTKTGRFVCARPKVYWLLCYLFDRCVPDSIRLKESGNQAKRARAGSESPCSCSGGTQGWRVRLYNLYPPHTAYGFGWRYVYRSQLRLFNSTLSIAAVVLRRCCLTIGLIKSVNEDAVMASRWERDVPGVKYILWEHDGRE